jgi:uncharacterized protein YuzE
MAIRVTYSTATDAAYIYLVPIGPGESKDMDVGVDRNMNVNLDYNAEGRLIGIEVLGASGTLPTRYSPRPSRSIRRQANGPNRLRPQ